MLRFIRSHITSSTEYKTEDLTDFFSYSKIASHGFPQKSSCIAVDEKLGIMAIGTKDGRIRIVGAEGIEWSTTIESGLPIAYIYFASGSGVLIALCDDSRSRTQSFYRCQIVNDRLSLARFNHGKDLKRISCCQMLNRDDGNCALLIGTVTGNVYALWTQNLELIDYLVFESTSLQRVKGLEETTRRIDKIVVHPNDSGKLFILFSNKIVVLYDTLQEECEKIFRYTTPITDIFYNSWEEKLYCATVDGSYLINRINDEHSDDTISDKFVLYPSVVCTKIAKISGTRLYNQTDLIAFTSGVPNELYGDRYTLTLHSAQKFLVLDFESPIYDFVFLTNDENYGLALFILCEQELVAIDIQHEHWMPFPLPHFNPLHSSPVISTAIFSQMSQATFLRLCAVAEEMERRNSASKFSPHKWPLKCGSEFLAQNKLKDLKLHDITLLLTGHENGCINIWLTNSLSLNPWVSCNTATEFEGWYLSENSEVVMPQSLDAVNAEELPLRKAGLFDSFCDDHRLAVVKLLFDIETAKIVAGGRAGHVMVFEPCTSEQNLPPPQVIMVDMTSISNISSCVESSKPSTSSAPSQINSTKYVRNKETAIPSRISSKHVEANNSFVLSYNTIIQFNPAVQVLSLAFSAGKGLVAAGNEFGYVICSLKHKEVLVKNCLLSSHEIVQISNLDGTLSRFKSVKKSIRQSFRRKKRLMENVGNIDESRTLNVLEECRPAEREIVQRVVNPNVLNGETPNSLVKVLQICYCRMGANLEPSDYLLAGTSGGSVLIHHILNDKILLRKNCFEEKSNSNNNTKWDFKCPLIREIRLKHGAPIINIECNQDLLSTRLLIFTEEQIRAYMLPTLKPSRYKCRFTAIEGSRIRKANTILLKNSKSKRIKSLERFIGLITNRGEVYILSLQNPRKTLHVPFTRSSDAAGIASAVLSTEGELFYLRTGGSEMQRASIAASPNYIAPSPFRDEQFLPLI